MTEPLLQVENIHKSYGGNEVLHGISLSAQKGDVISLIGSSGSGKSTFLRCINLLEMPDEGHIRLAGEEIRLGRNRRGERVALSRSQVAELRTRIGMVFQQFNLWSHMTVIENLIEAPIHVQGMARAEAKELALDLLAKVGIADKADAYPGFLSGGQQQRAAIARALAMRPEALLFDEPTSALDPELVGEVLSVMRKLAEEGTTMIVVTHEMAFARDVSNRVIYLYDGKIEEEGPPQTVFGQPASARLQKFLASANL